jgi:hypothetical protein
MDMMISFDKGILGEIIGILMDDNQSSNDMVYPFLVDLDQLSEPHLLAMRVLN